MKDLTEGLDDKIVKGLRKKIDELSSENFDLKNTITKQDKEINSLDEKISDLNSELENNNSRIMELEKNDSKVAELEKQISEVNSSKENEIANLKSEISSLTSRVEELTKKNEEITQSLSEKESKLEELSRTLDEREKVISEQKTQLEKTEEELTALKPVEASTFTSEDRLMCPSCGAVGKDIKSEEDRSKVLGYIGHSPMYGKKNVCKKCGEQF